MRTRLLLSGVGLTLVALFGWTGTAHAVSEEELREECIHILEEGGTADDCHEAPSPILPEANELIWGALSFLIAFGLLAKFGLPAIKKGLADRAEQIQSEAIKCRYCWSRVVARFRTRSDTHRRHPARRIAGVCAAIAHHMGALGPSDVMQVIPCGV